MKPASDLGWAQGFVIYNESDLAARRVVVDLFTHRLRMALTALNRAVRFFQIETPLLTHREALHGHEETGFELVKATFPKHGKAEMYLRPETTFGTYAAFRALYPMEAERKKQMPIVLWQYGKSFRDEQSRPMDELRFKEFYQLEYQLFFAPDTKADYFAACEEAVKKTVMSIVTALISIDMNQVKQEALAHYSVRTTDVIVDGKLEVAAISERKDFDGAKVVEVSVGLDRLTARQMLFM